MPTEKRPPGARPTPGRFTQCLVLILARLMPAHIIMDATANIANIKTCVSSPVFGTEETVLVIAALSFVSVSFA